MSLIEADIQKRQEIANAADERHAKMLATVIPYSSLFELPELVKEQLAILPTYQDRKPKVCALYYGGTLGMHWEERENEEGEKKKELVPTDDAKELLKPLEEWGLYDKMHIVWFPVTKNAIDSTNGKWPH